MSKTCMRLPQEMKIYTQSQSSRNSREQRVALRHIVADFLPGNPHHFLVVTS